MKQNKIEQQDIKLLSDILERNYYYYFKKGKTKNLSLSLYNDNNYNNSLFVPEEKCLNNQTKVLTNLQYILNWYKENNFLCDIYIEDCALWINDANINTYVFDIFYNSLKDYNSELNIYLSIELFNMTLIDIAFLKKQYQKFKQNNLNLIITFKDNFLLNKNYEDIFNFCNDTCSIMKIEINTKNLTILEKIYQKCKQKLNNYTSQLIFFEKESENWTENQIDLYIKFLYFYINQLLDIYNKETFINLIFNNTNTLFNLISLSDKGILDNSNCKGNCKFYKNLHIIINNLSISMCKKIQYEELIIGNFIIENNKITTYKPNNISALIIPAHLKRNMTPQCEYCEFIGFCPGFCHGDAYYKTLNPIIPLRESCLLRKAKYNFIIYLLLFLHIYEEDLIIQKYKENTYFSSYIINTINKIKNNYLKEGVL